VSVPQGGLTDLWLTDPYVIAAGKLMTWAIQENDAGKVFPVWGTCLGHQLLQILTANVNYTDLLVETDSVVRSSIP
jgi:gamma-glutamyl hydrolase